jgi:hypothetical protein
MYARVVRFTGADAETIAENVAGIKERTASGPPEGVPAVGAKFLADDANGTFIAISFYETEEDMRTGDATLNEMTPPAGDMGTRASVDLCEVKHEVQQ